MKFYDKPDYEAAKQALKRPGGRYKPYSHYDAFLKLYHNELDRVKRRAELLAAYDKGEIDPTIDDDTVGYYVLQKLLTLDEVEKYKLTPNFSYYTISYELYKELLRRGYDVSALMVDINSIMKNKELIYIEKLLDDQYVRQELFINGDYETVRGVLENGDPDLQISQVEVLDCVELIDDFPHAGWDWDNIITPVSYVMQHLNYPWDWSYTCQRESFTLENLRDLFLSGRLPPNAVLKPHHAVKMYEKYGLKFKTYMYNTYPEDIEKVKKYDFTDHIDAINHPVIIIYNWVNKYHFNFTSSYTDVTLVCGALQL